MDKVIIRGLKTEGVIGVFDWEREIRQAMIVDVELGSDIRQAATSDSITDALDYKAVSEFIQEYIASSKFELIETLAHTLAAQLMTQFSVLWLDLTLHKPGAISDAQDIAVNVRRGDLNARREHQSLVNVWLGLGSNQNAALALKGAITALQQRLGELHLSPVYESEAVGFDGPNFLNMVVSLKTHLSVGQLLATLRKIEDEHGRDREQPKFSSRTLDIDILLYEDRIGEIDGVSLPRGEILKNAFVLQPLADAWPFKRHPENGKTYAELWHDYDKTLQRLWRTVL